MVGAAAAIASGCGGYNQERGCGDVPIGDRESTSPLIVENADGFPNQAIKCVNLVDKGNGMSVGSYLIFETTHNDSKPSATHIERLPEGTRCPASGKLGFGIGD